MIPNFNEYGYLPPGIHKATWEEFIYRFGNNERRQYLLTGLKSALNNLKRAGCKTVYINGSFITSEPAPNDWDACWDIEGVNFDNLDRVIVDEEFNHARRKIKYLGDLFLNAARIPSRNFIDFFQKDRAGIPKGIIVIELENMQDSHLS